MSATNQPNLYSSTAQELQKLDDLTEEAKLYNEAVQRVLSRSGDKEVGAQERDLVLRHRTLEELLQALNQKREENQTFRTKHSSLLWNSSKAAVDTLARFEKAITSMAQAKSEVTMLIWGPIQFLVIVARDIFDTLDRLNDIGERLENCLDRFKYHMAEDIPKIGIKYDSLVLGPQKHYISTETAGHVFRKSIKVPFEQFLERLNYLAEEIHKTNTARSLHDIREAQRQNDQLMPPTSLQPDNPPLQNLRIIPDLLSNGFVGREDIIRSVGCSMASISDERTPGAALWGIPGIGKTQIALRFAERCRNQYTHIFFVNAASSATITSDYRTFARRLRLLRAGQDRPKESEVVDLVKTWLSEHTRWLMVFDNALEPGVVRHYTPVEGSGHILFTTRSQIAAEALAERANVLAVPAMTSTEAVGLALKLQNIDSTNVFERQAAEHLARLTGGLPIAIEQTVSLACLRKVALSTVLPDVEKRHVLLKQSHPLSMHEDGCSTGAIISLTLDTLKVQSPQAAALFQLLVYFDSSAIPKEVITRSSLELVHHFARLETYDRGFERPAAELREMRIKALRAREPWYYRELPTADFLMSRIPFRKRLPANTLPRVDSQADKNLERHLRDDSALKEVLEKPVRTENAFLDLRQAGLIRNLDVKTVWIHDLFAQLTIALVEGESQATHQVTAHTVLLMIYLVFPLPDHDEKMAVCFRYLPHAVSILQRYRPFYNDLTIGPELAHMAVSAFSLKISEFSATKDQDAVENAVFYYKLAFSGYHHAWKRLLDHPLVTEKEIIRRARAEYADEYGKEMQSLFRLHYIRNQRFGCSATVRTLQTCLKLGARVYGVIGQLDEAVKWTEMGVKGFQSLYGEDHSETYESRVVLLRLYRHGQLWVRGSVLGWVMGLSLLRRPDIGGVSALACAMGDCELGLMMPENAMRYYAIALQILTDLYGEDDRTHMIVLLKLATVEGLQHSHGKSLLLAQKGLKIYKDICRNQPQWNHPTSDRLIDLEVAIARQQFELGNFEEAKQGCERALRICKWDPKYDQADYAEYRSVWDSGLEAVWVWACIEFAGSTLPEEWDILSLNVTKDISSQALKKYRRLRKPCCGKEYGNEGWNPGYGVAAQCQNMLAALDELDQGSARRDC